VKAWEQCPDVELLFAPRDIADPFGVFYERHFASVLLMIWMPSLATTASTSRVNLLSRSRIRKRNDAGRCWSVQVN
jgi:hypothetical protein